jgi:hypothetical protein
MIETGFNIFQVIQVITWCIFPEKVPKMLILFSFSRFFPEINNLRLFPDRCFSIGNGSGREIIYQDSPGLSPE